MQVKMVQNMLYYIGHLNLIRFDAIRLTINIPDIVLQIEAAEESIPEWHDKKRFKA